VNDQAAGGMPASERGLYHFICKCQILAYCFTLSIDKRKRRAGPEGLSARRSSWAAADMRSAGTRRTDVDLHATLHHPVAAGAPGPRVDLEHGPAAAMAVGVAMPALTAVMTLLAASPLRQSQPTSQLISLLRSPAPFSVVAAAT